MRGRALHARLGVLFTAERGQRGQMAVELAVAMPVLVVAMVVALGALSFVGQCARFDHLAAQAVLAEGCSAPAGSYDAESRCAAVKQLIEEGLGTAGLHVDVRAQEQPGLFIWRTCTYTCTVRMAPWPFTGTGGNVFGLHIPAVLSHEYSLSTEPYVPGNLL